MNAFFLRALISAASIPGVWLFANASETASEAIAVRDSARIATVHAEGTQIYECKQKSEESPSQPRALIWQFREPIATLSSNGISIGRHYAGPNWDYFDGSGVKGKVVASAPGATENDIPWLKLDVVEHRGRRHPVQCDSCPAHQHQRWSRVRLLRNCRELTHRSLFCGLRVRTAELTNQDVE